MAIFASGAGSNAEKIMEHFENHPSVCVKLVVASKKNAGVLDRAARFGVETMILNKTIFFDTNIYVKELQNRHIDIVILAGFLWKVPANLVVAFQGRILNIHPALLPGYGGKGMYGHFVHEAVIAAGEKESGITIHLVDEVYDHGKHLYQATCSVEPTDSPDDLAKKIHELEHRHFAAVIENYIQENPVLFGAA
ncbi:phosphoribosylglycinamide formyltransferase-1 [Arachidicoccus rhizosphaerae]|uniref:phosphoribosylglycinamide formyltransferase 1 n=1 Tax=Arachidicoccus rhizosphaerae TaxID=551991 RepID=A0A1H3VT49_9BACT|nr:phosphoribosylglycinamide formyltransferase [Arachidicoccus rhizosphaerae]SDZ77993.1 phosphoribosylglycinamide formyltransferase-1 [Arachidicoccus rhizosphaerae]